ncbi:MAG TPA: M67 family metallopeptidase [Gaiellaceae bacterium]|nr:M67 family metallopeptidase [Gaiellaceae bacterium]
MVVIPQIVREALAEHARAELPNEACGLLLLRDGVAERFEPARNTLASPYRFEMEVDPELWFVEDEGFTLAVVHSHPSTEPKPSQTDVANIGLWVGRPYLIYSVARDELAAWTFAGGAFEPLELG